MRPSMKIDFPLGPASTEKEFFENRHVARWRAAHQVDWGFEGRMAYSGLVCANANDISIVVS
jgi:hypothetical protein